MTNAKKARQRTIGLPPGWQPTDLDLAFMRHLKTPKQDEGFRR